MRKWMHRAITFTFICHFTTQFTKFHIFNVHFTRNRTYTILISIFLLLHAWSVSCYVGSIILTISPQFLKDKRNQIKLLIISYFKVEININYISPTNQYRLYSTNLFHFYPMLKEERTGKSPNVVIVSWLNPSWFEENAKLQLHIKPFPLKKKKKKKTLPTAPVKKMA